MLACSGVLGLERARQRSDRLAVGVLHQDALSTLDLEQVPKVLGVQKHLLVLATAALGPKRHAETAAGEALDHRKQLERAEGLAQEAVRARAVGLELRAGLGAAEQDD